MIQRVSFIIRLILVFDFIRKVAGGYIYFPTTYNMTLQSRVLAGRHDKTNSNIYYCNFPEFDIKCLERSDFFLDVDLYQLQMNTLRRYKKHFKVPVRQGMNKMQLADVSLYCNSYHI